METTDDTDKNSEFEDILTKFKEDPKYNFTKFISLKKDIKQRASKKYEQISDMPLLHSEQDIEEEMIVLKHKHL